VYKYSSVPGQYPYLWTVVCEFVIEEGIHSSVSHFRESLFLVDTKKEADMIVSVLTKVDAIPLSHYRDKN